MSVPTFLCGFGQTATIHEFADHTEVIPPLLDFMKAVGLRESQTKLAASLLHNANKDHNFALEAMILQYRKDLLSALDDQSKKITAAADNHPELGIILNNLTFEFQSLGRKYVPLACNLGFARALKDLKVRGWITKIHGDPKADESISAGLLMENIRYLQDALLPAMHFVLYGAGAPEIKLAGMKSRIASYSHYLWKASERAYILTMKEFFSKVKPKRKKLKVVVKESKLLLVTKIREGGEGSGNHGHAGVPGSVGGSAAGGVSAEHRELIQSIIKQHVASSWGQDDLALKLAVNRTQGKDELANLTDNDKYNVDEQRNTENFDEPHTGVLSTFFTNKNEYESNMRYLPDRQQVPYATVEDENKALDTALTAYTKEVAAWYDQRYPNGHALYRGVSVNQAAKLESLTPGAEVSVGPVISTSQTYVQSSIFPKYQYGSAVMKFEGVRGKDVIEAEERKPELFSEMAGHSEVIMRGNATTWRFIGSRERGNGIKEYRFTQHTPGQSKRESTYIETGNLREGSSTSGNYGHVGVPGQVGGSATGASVQIGPGGGTAVGASGKRYGVATGRGQGSFQVLDGEYGGKQLGYVAKNEGGYFAQVATDRDKAGFPSRYHTISDGHATSEDAITALVSHIEAK